jgi:hypothetical protein
MNRSAQNFTSSCCRASAGEVVTWIGAIAERSRSTPAATLNSDEITESSARRLAKANASICARVRLAIIFMEISLQSLAATNVARAFLFPN